MNIQKKFKLIMLLKKETTFRAVEYFQFSKRVELVNFVGHVNLFLLWTQMRFIVNTLAQATTTEY